METNNNLKGTNIKGANIKGANIKGTNIKKFICSSDIFQGYNILIDLNECDNIEDILIIFKKSMMKFFEDNSLEILVNKVNNIDLHIHTNTFEDILISKRNTTFYICENSSCMDCSFIKKNILLKSIKMS